MDTKSFLKDTSVAAAPSRLPAGSTLKVGDIHVPHPHAEANLPGAGDPRLGDTKAVTEEVVVDEAAGTAKVDVRPLDEEVRPTVATTADDVVKLADLPSDGISTEKKLAVEEPGVDKTA